MEWDNDLRHFVLWAKGIYKKSLDEVVCKLTASPPEEVSMRDKLYWLKKTCKQYGITGYQIIDLFEEKSGMPDDIVNYESELHQLLSVMKIKLMMIKTRREDGSLIYDWGKYDLFDN
ncbi:MAG: hypothetical protein ACLFNO_04015 [Parcubacteria group bacterium]